jgi:hypothetical protein
VGETAEAESEALLACEIQGEDDPYDDDPFGYEAAFNEAAFVSSE